MTKQEGTILITKPISDSDQKLLKELSISYQVMPALAYATEFSEPTISSLTHQRFDCWLFTSHRAVDAIKEILHAVKNKNQFYIKVVGHKCTQALNDLGFTNIKEQPSSKDLIHNTSWEGLDSILYFCGNHLTDLLPDFFRQKNIDCTQAKVYNTKPIYPEFQNDDISNILYFSPISVQSCLKNNEWIKKIPAIAIGLTTSATLRTAGFKKIKSAEQPNLKSMLDIMYQAENQHQ